MILTRRDFLRGVGTLGAAAIPTFRTDAVAHVLAASAQIAGRTPEDIARDEFYWRDITQAFAIDRTIINLDNGSVCPSPRVVHEAYKRYLDISHQAPAYHMWKLLEPNVEAVRRQLAGEFGCDPEDLAITRNGTESLQIAQLGLDLRPGDEVVTTDQEGSRTLNTWEQRVRRDGVVLKTFSFAVPAPSLENLIQRCERALTARTRILQFSHLTDSTGQIFPVRELSRLARTRGIRTIVDGSQAVAHVPVRLRDLECDFYATSLHKWLLAPVGTGFLYVRRGNLPALWPLRPAPNRMTDIRKLEQYGTHPAAGHNAIAEALTFHQALGVERKTARLGYLKSRWARRLVVQPRIHMFSNLDQPGGLATVSIAGLDPTRMADYLWDRHRIIVAPVKHAEYQGIRVTPNIYTALEEVDTFAGAMEEILREGL